MPQPSKAKKSKFNMKDEKGKPLLSKQAKRNYDAYHARLGDAGEVTSFEKLPMKSSILLQCKKV